jgi:hypothetical protein
MMEAVHTSEMSTNLNMITQRYILEDSKRHAYHHESLKSHNFISFHKLWIVLIVVHCLHRRMQPTILDSHRNVVLLVSIYITVRSSGGLQIVFTQI